MNTLQQDLHTVSQQLYAKGGSILTPADVPNFKDLIRATMKSVTGRVVDEITADLFDTDEMVTITITDGDETAELTLEWKSLDGTYYMRIDTDGDGE